MSNPSDKDKAKAEREARLADNLRANLRRRKAASRKNPGGNKTDNVS